MLRRLLAGYVTTQILASAVRLGIVDQLEAEPQSVDELSAASRVAVPELRRYIVSRRSTASTKLD